MLGWQPDSQTWLITNSIPAGTELFKMYACTWFVEFLRDIHAQASMWPASVDTPSALQAAKNVMEVSFEMRNTCPSFFASDRDGIHLQDTYTTLFGTA